MPAIIVLVSICGALAMPIPMLNDFLTICIMLWLYFFFGAIMLPILTGVMISSVEPHLKSKANALANLSYNLIGYFPAPFIYGAICERTGGEKSRWGLSFTFLMNAPPFILLALTTFRKRKQFQYEDE